MKGVKKMNKLIATGIMFLILSAFVSPALAADATRAEPIDYKMYTLESSEDTEKLIDFLEENQKVEIYNAESKEDLNKIVTTLSDDLGIDGKEILESIEQPTDKALADNDLQALLIENSADKALDDNDLQALNTEIICQNTLIIIFTPYCIYIIIIW